MQRLLYIILYVVLAVHASAQVKVTGRVIDLQNKPVSDVIAAGERQRLAAAHQFHNHVTHGLVLQVYHPSRHLHLCRRMDGQHHI